MPRADKLKPLHSNTTKPVNATEIRNRGRVRKTRRALHGGNLDLADFHVTPPFGSSMVWVLVNALVDVGRYMVSHPPLGRGPGGFVANALVERVSRSRASKRGGQEFSRNQVARHKNPTQGATCTEEEKVRRGPRSGRRGVDGDGGNSVILVFGLIFQPLGHFRGSIRISRPCTSAAWGLAAYRRYLLACSILQSEVSTTSSLPKLFANEYGRC